MVTNQNNRFFVLLLVFIMSGNQSGLGAAKRTYGDDPSTGSCGSGRGSGRPPGTPSSAISDTLAKISAQLANQTAQLKKLADKDDIHCMSKKLDGLVVEVTGHTSEIAAIKNDQQEDWAQYNQRIGELERKVELLAEASSLGLSTSLFNKDLFQRERYQSCRRSLRFWPVPVVLGHDDDQDLEICFTKMRAAVCVYLRDLLKVDSHEDLDMEDISFPRVVARSKIRNKVLVRFSSVAERDEVISHAVNLKDCATEAGVRLEIPHHLQADFKVLIQYGNEARKHYGGEVRRSVRFFEEDYGLVLHLGLPSGQWLRVTPSEAREMGRFCRSRADSAMKKTLSASQSLDETLLREEAAKAFFPPLSPLMGANAVPLTSLSPLRNPSPGPAQSLPASASPAGIVNDDVAMPEAPVDGNPDSNPDFQ